MGTLEDAATKHGQEVDALKKAAERDRETIAGLSGSVATITKQLAELTTERNSLRETNLRLAEALRTSSGNLKTAMGGGR